MKMKTATTSAAAALILLARHATASGAFLRGSINHTAIGDLLSILSQSDNHLPRLLGSLRIEATEGTDDDDMMCMEEIGLGARSALLFVVPSVSDERLPFLCLSYQLRRVE